MSTLVPNPNVGVPGGYRFTDSDGVLHEAASAEQLHHRVAAYRERNGMPPGDPAREYAAQLCASRPHLCIEEKTRRKGSLNGLPLYTTILTWLANIFSALNQHRTQYNTSPRERQRRAEICGRCKHQVAWREHSGCNSCLTDYQVVSKAIMAGREVHSLETSLQGCSMLGEDTRISVHINQEPVDNDELPAECWRKSK